MSEQIPEGLTRSLPQSIDVEKRVLSSLIQDPERHAHILRAMQFAPDYFYKQSHRTLYEIVLNYIDEGQSFDVIILTDYFRAKSLLENMGGVSELTDIATCETLHSNFKAYAKLLKEKALLRSSIGHMTQIRELSYSEPEDATEIISLFESSLLDLKRIAQGESVLATGKEAVNDFAETFEAITNGEPTAKGVPSGLDQLDKFTGGMRGGRLIIPSAPTSGGKSVFALQMARAFLDKGKKTIIFTLEMGREEVAQRLICHKGKVSNDILSGGKAPVRQDLQRIVNASQWLKDAPLLIDDSTTHIDEACSIAEIEHERDPVHCIVYDYIQIGQGHRNKGDTREMEISDIVRKLKQLAKRLNCYVIAPSQLTDDGKLRESRAIGQHADIVLSIEQQRIYLSKNRGGRRHVDAPYVLNGELQSFEIPTANYDYG